MLPNKLQQAVERFLQQLQGHRDVFSDAVSNMAAGGVAFSRIMGVHNSLAQLRADIVDLKGRPGAQQYAKNLFGNAGLDVGTLLNSLQTAVETAGVGIRADTPKQSPAPQYLEVLTFHPDATVVPQFVWRTLTSAETASIQTNLNAVIAAIDDLYGAIETTA